MTTNSLKRGKFGFNPLKSAPNSAIHMMNTREASNRKQVLPGWVLKLSRGQRFSLGLLASAITAWFVPQLIIILITGMWAGGLKMPLANLAAISVLMGINLVGNKLNRTLLVAFMVAVGVTFYEVSFINRAMDWAVWQVWMLHMIVPSTIAILNAYLLEKYKAMAGFSR